MLRLALIVNEPPPYRIPVFNRVAAHPGIQLQVIFCCRREPNRAWDLPGMHFEHRFLNERITTVAGRYIHNNPEVLWALSRFAPDVVIGNGFNPTHLYAFAWCRLKNLPYIPMTDGTLMSERSLSRLHLGLRRYIYARAPAAIAASRGGLALYQKYGLPPSMCYQSCLCIDNERFRPTEPALEKAYDFIFCGRIEAAKQPAFALEVASRCAQILGRKVSILFVGSGSQLESLQVWAKACSDRVAVTFHGFAKQAELPDLYRSARIFLFPTLADVWGVVANEACASGLPVLSSPHAGVANELVLENQNGHILELNAERWAESASALLAQPQRLRAFGQRSLLMVQTYHFEAAAHGMIQASLASQQTAKTLRTGLRGTA